MHKTSLQLNVRWHARFARTFSVRSLVLLVFAACTLLAWLSNIGARDRLAVAGIVSEGGHVIYDYDEIPGWRSSPRLKRMLRGSNFGEGLVWGAYQISYYPTTRVTDEGLRHLSEFPETKVLGLNETKITDDGLVHLTRLRELRYLNLAQTTISGTGLKHLTAFTSLEVLDLSDTAMSDFGLEQLPPLCNLSILDLGNTNITDAGLVHLYGLRRLQVVDLTGTSVTSVGIELLQTALPECLIDAQLPNVKPVSM